MQLLRSLSDSPAFHCALEEYFLTERLNDVLLLYINQPSVIVGRNQQVEAEVDLPYCAEQGIPVVRRISGGGTVFHDLGNINYSFITNKGERSLLDIDPTEPVVAALRSFGIPAETGPRKEITVGGYKVSGTASHIARTRQLFHGTLLFDTNLNALASSLRGDHSKRGRRVASVPSPVMNLNRYPGFESYTTEEFLLRLFRFFERYYQCASYQTLSSEEVAQVEEMALERYSTLSSCTNVSK